MLYWCVSKFVYMFYVSWSICYYLYVCEIYMFLVVGMFSGSSIRDTHIHVIVCWSFFFVLSRSRVLDISTCRCWHWALTGMLIFVPYSHQIFKQATRDFIVLRLTDSVLILLIYWVPRMIHFFKSHFSCFAGLELVVKMLLIH